MAACLNNNDALAQCGFSPHDSWYIHNLNKMSLLWLQMLQHSRAQFKQKNPQQLDDACLPTQTQVYDFNEFHIHEPCRRTHTHAVTEAWAECLQCCVRGDPGRQLFLALVSSFLSLRSACSCRLVLHSNEETSGWKWNTFCLLHAPRDKAPAAQPV